MSDDILLDAVKATASEHSSAIYPLPSFVTTASEWISTGHLLWWTFKDHTLFNKAHGRDGNPVVYGAALHLLSEYSTTIGYIVKATLIAKCAEDLIFQYGKVHQAYVDLSRSLFRDYPRYNKQDWASLNTHKFAKICPSLFLSFYTSGVRFFQTSSRVLGYSATLIKEIFILSMRSTDVCLIANGHALTRLRACTEMIGNWKNYQTQLGDDFTFLLTEMDKKKEFIDRIFIKLNMDKRTSDLVSDLRKIAEQAGKHLPTAMEVTSATIEPLFVTGKITDLGFADEEDDQPEVTPGRFPSWTGQHLEGQTLEDLGKARRGSISTAGGQSLKA